MLSNFHYAMDMFVGDFNASQLVDYAVCYPFYNVIFMIGAILALWASFSVAISVF